MQNIWRRYRELRVTTKRSRPGRKRGTTARKDRRLILVSRQLRFNTLHQLCADWIRFLGHGVSEKTVRRRLHAARVYNRIARRKPLIYVLNRQKRVRWCNRIRNWTTLDNWSHIVFSDESRFTLNGDDNRVRCWRSPGEAFNPDALAFRTRSSV